MEVARVELASKHIALRISTLIFILFEVRHYKRRMTGHPVMTNLISLFSLLQVEALSVSPLNLGPRSRTWTILGGSTLSAY